MRHPTTYFMNPGERIHKNSSPQQANTRQGILFVPSFTPPPPSACSMSVAVALSFPICHHAARSVGEMMCLGGTIIFRISQKTRERTVWGADLCEHVLLHGCHLSPSHSYAFLLCVVGDGNLAHLIQILFRKGKYLFCLSKLHVLLE
jgi:hypothetical protein